VGEVEGEAEIPTPLSLPSHARVGSGSFPRFDFARKATLNIEDHILISTTGIAIIYFITRKSSYCCGALWSVQPRYPVLRISPKSGRAQPCHTCPETSFKWRLSATCLSLFANLLMQEMASIFELSIKNNVLDNGIRKLEHETGISDYKRLQALQERLKD
jgi:hypothetical protein